MKKISYFISLFLSFLFLFSSCERESSNGIATYLNPTKDSIKFAYRVSTLYYNDYNNTETSFEFELDSGTLYAWKSISIIKNSSIKIYTPEYTNGLITKLVEEAPTLENIEIEYALMPPSNIRLVSKLKYYRVSNAFALVFVYDSARLARVERRYLDRLTGNVGGVLESYRFCPNDDIGACVDTITNPEFQYSFAYNNLYHCHELLPIMLLLNKSKQSSLRDIFMDFPYYFSRHYPETIISPINGYFQRGINADKEATFLYYGPSNSSSVQGYNFSMR